jgi:hypothetical protein
MQRKALWRGLCGFILAAFLLWSIVDSESFRDCVHDRKDHKLYQALHKDGTLIVESFYVRSRLNLACGFVSVNKNNGAIAALAGIMVAFFTFTLWQSTVMLWEGTQRDTGNNGTILCFFRRLCD